MNEDLAKEALLAWAQQFAERNNKDYDFNPDKVDKMNDVIAFCRQLELLYENCKLIRLQATPKYQQGFVELLVEGDWEIGRPPETVECFKKVVALSDGVNIAPLDDNFFNITFFVDDLYLKVTEQG